MTEAAPWILEIRRRLEREWVVPDVVREIAEGTPDARPAAVLVPLYVRERELWTLLTKRSETVESHRGQIAFPGGMEALDDASPWETAIRETEEEIGLPRKAILRIGELPGVTTFTGFRIRAFVGAIPYPFDVRHDPREVDAASGGRQDLAFQQPHLSGGDLQVSEGRLNGRGQLDADAFHLGAGHQGRGLRPCDLAAIPIPERHGEPDRHAGGRLVDLVRPEKGDAEIRHAAAGRHR